MVLFVNIMYLADNLDVGSRPSLALRSPFASSPYYLSILMDKKRGDLVVVGR